MRSTDHRAQFHFSLEIRLDLPEEVSKIAADNHCHQRIVAMTA